MFRFIPWLFKKNDSNISSGDIFSSFIAEKKTKELLSFIRTRQDGVKYIERCAALFGIIEDPVYFSTIIEMIRKKSSMTQYELDQLASRQFLAALKSSDTLMMERLMAITSWNCCANLPTPLVYLWMKREMDQFRAMDLMRSIVEKSLVYDKNYVAWFLLGLFEAGIDGYEILIEFLLALPYKTNPLEIECGTNGVTPLMMFLHHYNNEKCQQLIEKYFGKMNDKSFLLKSDRWGRSYLDHLVCSQCKHDQSFDNIPLSEDIDNCDGELHHRCSNGQSFLSRFVILHQLGVPFQVSIKSILNSNLCFALRLLLLNYFCQIDHHLISNSEAIILHFPSTALSAYSIYLKRLLSNVNLNKELTLLIRAESDGYGITEKLTFLLKIGARLQDTLENRQIIGKLLRSEYKTAPFILVEHGMFIDPPLEDMPQITYSNVSRYICLLINLGFPTIYRSKFAEFKAKQTAASIQNIEKTIDTKRSFNLKSTCIRKIRSSIKNFETSSIEYLQQEVTTDLYRLFVNFGKEERQRCFRLIT